MKTLGFLATVILAAACVEGSVSTTTTTGVTSLPASTTSTTSTTVPVTTATGAPGPFDVPQIDLDTAYDDGVPAQGLPDALLHVSGPCVTAETPSGTYLLVWIDGYADTASIRGSEVHILEGWGPDSERVLASGSRYHFRGVPDPFEEELLEELPPDCIYDARFLLFGVLPAGPDVMTSEFPSYTSGVGLAYPGGPSETGPVTIDGGCVTLPTNEGGTGLLVWPAGSVALLPDGAIRFSFWENVIDTLIRPGDQVGGWGDWTPHGTGELVNNPPPACDYDELINVWWVGRD